MAFTHKSLTLTDLPSAPPGKTGWPWTEKSQPLPTHMPDGSEWPRISIVTPSYNQDRFIEETIRSVLLQGYPNLEYIIIDGGSTDNSIEIIKKYEKYLTYWISERDRGQSHAINKGLRCITGEIWAYLNSDDRYLKGAFEQVALKFRKTPKTVWVTGYARYLDENGDPIEDMIPIPVQDKKDALIRWESSKRYICIEVANFMHSNLLSKYGFYNESFHYCMDFDFNLRLFFNNINPVIIKSFLAEAHRHKESKTTLSGREYHKYFREEDLIIIEKYMAYLNKNELKYVKNKLSKLRLWLSLTSIDKELSTVGKLSSIQKISNILIMHPYYLLNRRTWGMIRRILMSN
ncbi:MAG: glycosyltransferase family 2 protein [Coleofasciculus sp. G3-WIS-01]|uniref:glycosyltransferase family 2 protein n=1 Tax=Coleofasciculus sp. G3-WIS-01 TaxID=3069528 RepID=UPI0032F37624